MPRSLPMTSGNLEFWWGQNIVEVRGDREDCAMEAGSHRKSEKITSPEVGHMRGYNKVITSLQPLKGLGGGVGRMLGVRGIMGTP